MGRKNFKFPSGKIFTPMGMMIWPPANAIYRKETYDNYPAVKAILKCVYEGLQLPIDQALRVESRYFAQIMRSKGSGRDDPLAVPVDGRTEQRRAAEGRAQDEFREDRCDRRGLHGRGHRLCDGHGGAEVVLSTATRQLPTRARAFRRADFRACRQRPRQGNRQGSAPVAHQGDGRLCRPQRAAT